MNSRESERFFPEFPIWLWTTGRKAYEQRVDWQSVSVGAIIIIAIAASGILPLLDRFKAAEKSRQG